MLFRPKQSPLNWRLLRRKEQVGSSQRHKKIPMKILLCDDQAVIRDGLEMLLNLEKDFQVVGAAQDGAEALELAAKKQPDLILMDLKMPIMNGIEAIRGTMEGKSFVDPAVAGKLLNQVASKQTQPTSILTDKLTERELDVLRLIAKGINNSEIAAQLHLSEGTVRNHVSAILEKLGVSDRTQAAVIAIQHGF